MNRQALLIGMLALSTIACAADPSEEGDSAEEAEAIQTVALGVDTNGSTINLDHLDAVGYSFVGRYLSFDGEHPALTPQEAQRIHEAGVPIVAIWETGQQRAVQAGSVKGQWGLGVEDAQKAKAAMAACGDGGKPIYFTVDFNVTDDFWKAKVKDKETGKMVTHGQIITAYFNAIKSVIGLKRVGVYGTYTTVKELFDAKIVSYGWQQTFGGKGNKIDPRAQLRQYDIYPSQDGWGVSGAGALDLDRAVKKDFGQF